MPIISIVLTFILEQRKLLTDFRAIFNNYLLSYISFFTSNKKITTQREIRYIYLFACLPVIIVLLVLKLSSNNHVYVLYLVKLILFILSIQFLTWKEQAKSSERNLAFIQTFATYFFAALFWYLVLPACIGLMCYLIIIAISEDLKHKAPDLVVYNVVVDKMLFYANIIPYSVLFVFIAIAGNFEDVMHYIVGERKNFNKSFFFLENTLNEIILIAISKEKFKVAQKSYSGDDAIEANELYQEKLSPEIRAYIVALLYRSGIFFTILVGIISVANLLR